MSEPRPTWDMELDLDEDLGVDTLIYILTTAADRCQFTGELEAIMRALDPLCAYRDSQAQGYGSR